MILCWKYSLNKCHYRVQYLLYTMMHCFSNNVVLINGMLWYCFLQFQVVLLLSILFMALSIPGCDATLVADMQQLVQDAPSLNGLSLARFIGLVMGTFLTIRGTRLRRGVPAPRRRHQALLQRMASALHFVQPSWNRTHLHSLLIDLHDSGKLWQWHDIQCTVQREVHKHMGDPQTGGHILLEYGGDNCCNAQCGGIALKTRGDRTRIVKVVTVAGMRYGLHRVKRCQRCGMQYFYNYFTSSHQGRRIVQWYTTSDRSPHEYIKTGKRIYFEKAMCQFLDFQLYHQASSFVGAARAWNRTWGNLSILRRKTHCFVSEDGKQFTTAWKWFKLMESKCSGQCTSPLQYRAGARVDDLITAEVDRMKQFDNQFAEHQCNTIGCFGAAGDGNAYDVVVIDGIECIQGHR